MRSSYWLTDKSFSRSWVERSVGVASNMRRSSNQAQPAYGLLVNGREFVFIQLVHRPTPKYARSFALSIERNDELAQVLGVLKKFASQL